MDELGLISGLTAAGQGFLSGMRDAEDRKLKRLEFDAKLKSAERERQEREANKRLELWKAGAEVPPEGQEIDPANLKYRQDYLDLKTKEAAAMGGKMLPADTALKVQEGATIPAMLKDIAQTLTNKAERFGPVSGRMSSFNPYDTEAQTIDAQMRTASQAFGRFMEGGVLRKEDEEKYRKMFPQLSDTPELAQNKLAIVQRLLAEKQNANISALGAQGYRTKGFQQTKVPDAPGLLNKGPAGPRVGEIVDGYKFMGGDPADQKSWKKAN